MEVNITHETVVQNLKLSNFLRAMIYDFESTNPKLGEFSLQKLDEGKEFTPQDHIDFLDNYFKSMYMFVAALGMMESSFTDAKFIFAALDGFYEMENLEAQLEKDGIKSNEYQEERIFKKGRKEFHNRLNTKYLPTERFVNRMQDNLSFEDTKFRNMYEFLIEKFDQIFNSEEFRIILNS